MSDCKYGDPACPCQDGDTCHYEGENPMTPPYTLTPNSGGWNCTSADGKICVYGRTQEEAIMNCGVAVGAGMLAAEKLRADAFRELLDWLMKVDWYSKDNKELSNGVADITHYAVKLLARTPEEWAALALGGKEQSNG